MEIQDIRRERLREWLVGRTAPAKEKSYFSQLINGTASFGERAARRIEKDYGMDAGYLDSQHDLATSNAPIKAPKGVLTKGSQKNSGNSIHTDDPKSGYKNVSPAPRDQRHIPVISYVQAGKMTEVVDPFALGDGFEIILTDLDVSERTFALIIEGLSMLPEFNEGDKVIIDPELSPRPGDFVVAKNGHEEATFKKYRPRGTGDRGEMVFELVPLNDDFPTLHSERDHLHIIGVMAEHRKYRKR
jgi:SOS-response transcriptional repressor LexA